MHKIPARRKDMEINGIAQVTNKLQGYKQWGGGRYIININMKDVIARDDYCIYSD